MNNWIKITKWASIAGLTAAIALPILVRITDGEILSDSLKYATEFVVGFLVLFWGGILIYVLIKAKRKKSASLNIDTDNEFTGSNDILFSIKNNFDKVKDSFSINTTNTNKNKYRLMVVAAITAACVFDYFLFVTGSDVLKSHIYNYQVECQKEQINLMKELAFEDITKADSIARKLFNKTYEQGILNIYKDKSGDWYNENWELCNNIAFKILRNAAEKGDHKSQFTLGCVYGGAEFDHLIAGSNWNDSITIMKEPIDEVRETYWYKQAAEGGIHTAMGNLANAYFEGRGVSINKEKGVEWIKKAAKTGKAYYQRWLGDLYSNGVWGSYYDEWILPRDIEQAKYWWRKAAEQGDEDAKKNLEKIYE